MISITGLHKSFGEQDVLRGVDLSIRKGTSHIIIGRSGCGKSVLLKHIIGLMQPDLGSVVVDDIDLSQQSRAELYALRRKIGMVFQGAALFDSMTVEENICLGVREHRLFSESEILKRAADALAMVGLPSAGSKMPSELSGGMKKRVGLARALMMAPEYVLYDEPTTGLDPIMADTINDLIIRINQEMGVTAVVVTHDMASAYKVGTMMSMLHEGRVIFNGTPHDIRVCEDSTVQRFISGNQMPPLDT